MIALENMILPPMADDDFDWRFGSFNLPITIFGQEHFAQHEGLGLTLQGDIDLASFVDAINDYLLWLSDCRQALEASFSALIGRAVPADWYDRLLVLDGTIMITENGELRSGFTLVEPLDTMRTLVVDFNGHRINRIYYEG